MIILILMVFTGALGGNPDITVTGYLTETKPGYNIECDSNDKPLEIDFLTDEKTECVIKTQKGSCSYFFFEHFELGRVKLVSEKNPSKDQTFGCEMIFNDTHAFVKVYCSVNFNGTDFVQIPKQITRTTNFSYIGDVNIIRIAQDKDKNVIIIVNLALAAFLFVIVLFICIKKNAPTPSSRTRQRCGMSSEIDGNDIMLAK